MNNATSNPVFYLVPSGTTATSNKTTDPLLQAVTITANAGSSVYKPMLSPEEIEEREWESIVRKPRVLNRLRELGRQALEEDEAGETEEGGFDCL